MVYIRVIPILIPAYRASFDGVPFLAILHWFVCFLSNVFEGNLPVGFLAGSTIGHQSSIHMPECLTIANHEGICPHRGFLFLELMDETNSQTNPHMVGRGIQPIWVSLFVGGNCWVILRTDSTLFVLTLGNLTG